MKNKPLFTPYFTSLPLGSIKPKGWLERQLRIQADGLSGHLDEFWPDIQESSWFGGQAEGWERAPYWLDGVVPLAFLLEDGHLIGKVTRYIDFILSHQQEDGWLGPVAKEPARVDLWGQILIFKPLIQFYEATEDARIPGAVERALKKIDRHIDTAPLFNWGHSRWFEALIPLYWLYERAGENWLLELAVKLHAQGFDWEAFFERWPFTESTPVGRWNYMSHVVNNAMMVKSPGLWWRMTGATQQQHRTHEIIEQLERYHGMVTGMFSGDECLAGKRPTQGTELCAVVEYAYSLETLLVVFGEAAFGDRLERVIFNALPATFSPDMWSHQYDQQVNQVECSIRPDRGWVANGPDSNIFGVDPNYGCCTANLSQGWPKFTAHLWMRTQAGGLAAVAYAPSQVETLVEGTPVKIVMETEYPFRQNLHLTVQVEHSVLFPLELRIPAWAKGATISIRGEKLSGVEPGSFFRIEREWTGTTEVEMHFPAAVHLIEGFRGARAMGRGPLVYALPIGEDWRRVNADKPYRELPHADWEVYPTTPWNYALQVEASKLLEQVVFDERPIGKMPFSSQGAPVRARVKGRRVIGWVMEHGSAQDAPLSPVTSDEPIEDLTLIPYGCTNLRITEFPLLTFQ